jgi:sterol desaturase/sphingolipid hydroxylase (fatty acid hydroxylase superfamily)
MAIIAAERGWGVLNLAPMSGWLAGFAGFLILDFVIYAQHYVFHHVPWLWRLHRMHHADLDIDLTTGVRFHPFEIVISMVIKIAIVLAFGIPAVAVLIFEIVLNATSIFNHANIAMPAWLDRLMRLIVVTPDMHRVHHSIVRTETDSNFGFNLPWWDWLFGTYRAQPLAGHQRMTIGLPIFRDHRELRIDHLLTQPFRSEPPASDDPPPVPPELNKI